jgi:polar amino acid transport system substrate-binding protein
VPERRKIVVQNLANASLSHLLAPSGRLRVAINLGNPVLAQRGECGILRGVSVELALALAEEIGMPADFITYASGGAAVSGLSSDSWDIAFLAAEPERARDIRFTDPYLFIEGACMVSTVSPFMTFAQLDRPGVQIAVGEGAAYHHILARTLKHAALRFAPTSAAAIELFAAERLDAAAGVRQTLETAAPRMGDVRILPDSFSRIGQAMAVPRDRPDAVFEHVAGFLASRIDAGSIDAFLALSGQSAIVARLPHRRPGSS